MRRRAAAFVAELHAGDLLLFAGSALVLLRDQRRDDSPDIELREAEGFVLARFGLLLHVVRQELGKTFGKDDRPVALSMGLAGENQLDDPPRERVHVEPRFLSRAI